VLRTRAHVAAMSSMGVCSKGGSSGIVAVESGESMGRIEVPRRRERGGLEAS
jgi:hypothetical protein